MRNQPPGEISSSATAIVPAKRKRSNRSRLGFCWWGDEATSTQPRQRPKHLLLVRIARVSSEQHRLIYIASWCFFLISCARFCYKVRIRYFVANNSKSHERQQQPYHQQQQQQQFRRADSRPNDDNSNTLDPTTPTERRNDSNTTTSNNNSHDGNENPQQQRILYIMTSIAEYDTGFRQTIQGYNRFSKTIVPVLRESVTSMIEHGYHVDVYIITQYNITDARYNEVASQLPPTVGIQIWDDATPIGYSHENSIDHVMYHTRGLSRQHRYVIKDKLLYYDIFVCFEDDMLIRGPHIDHYIHMTDALYQLRLRSPNQLLTPITLDEAKENFYGPMTNRQLARTIPGFMRVEVALPDFVPSKRPRLRHDRIPVDYDYWTTTGTTTTHPTTTNTSPIDASICCHVSRESSNEQLPMAPLSNELYYWEMNIESMGVRRMPDPIHDIQPFTTTTNEEISIHNATNMSSSWFLDWVVLLGGSNNEVWEDPSYPVGDYWSGRGPQQYLGKTLSPIVRPDRREGQYANNQGGWMATRRQLLEWHIRWCRGGFLPPYDLPHYHYDGLDSRSVEYWSGGIQLVGINSCNLQRIVSLEPQGFARHLLYHTSNNKQRSKRVRRQFSGRPISEFWGQLNTIRKAADTVRLGELQQQQQTSQ